MTQTKQKECDFGGCHRAGINWMVTRSGTYYRCCDHCAQMLKTNAVMGTFFKLIAREGG